MKKIIIIILIIFSGLNLCIKARAETASELRDQIENTNKQIEALEKEIKKYQNQIAETAEQANSLANIINELNITRNKLLAEKNQTEKKIQATNLIIEKISGDIDEQQNFIDNGRKSLSLMIQELRRQDQELFLEKILAKETLAEMSREYNSIISVNENIRKFVNELEIKKQELSENKNQKEEEGKKLSSLKQTLTEKEQAVLVSKKEKDKILTETKNQQAEYERLMKESQKKMEDFEKAIDDYEAKLELVLNQKSIPKARHGVLSWPIDNILITSLFGDRCISGVCRFHSGIDLRASVGTSVKSMQSGVIEGVGDTDIDCKGASYGKWVLIKYDNGLSSVYGHLSSILVKEGQKVKAGDTVALSGNTGYSTGPHLHVGLFASAGVKVDTVPSQSCAGAVFKQPMLTAKNARLDPLLYLPETTKSMFK